MAKIKTKASSPKVSKRKSTSQFVPSEGYDSKLTLSSGDFEVPDNPKPQANVTLFGAPKEGKTTFATRFAPDPTMMFNFDRRDRHAIVSAIESGRDVRRVDLNYSANLSKLGENEAKTLAWKVLDKMSRNLDIAVNESLKGNVRTICIDTGTEWAELLYLAFRGHLNLEKDYGRSKGLINTEMRRVFNLAREGNAHLIVLARSSAVWLDNAPTGRSKPRGPSVLEDAPDWVGQIRTTRPESVITGKLGKPQFELEITHAGIDADQVGEVYTQDMWEDIGGPFVLSCMMQYPGTTMEDWT